MLHRREAPFATGSSLPTAGAGRGSLRRCGQGKARPARAGRDAAVELVESAARTGRDLRGFEVDRACREVVTQAGFGPQFVHRTGHSLVTNVRGHGVHMDDYETHDYRRLLPGTGFTIEPGVYFSSFGVRTEINMFYDASDARVSGPAQAAILALG